MLGCQEENTELSGLPMKGAQGYNSVIINHLLQYIYFTQDRNTGAATASLILNGASFVPVIFILASPLV